ncbi:RING-H2 finger protein ATL78 [Acorus calamus]|uniref:RING-H2 finger protein ATL78 n=1 Tax=Acorus calamus TaxID=4465 RepID=A0AAV9FEF3_ACOCL|nr:RING-H2 finger protein ATL78 [Acorus calamus]
MPTSPPPQHLPTTSSRRLLLHSPPPPPPSPYAPGAESSFDANVVMILAVLLCALICALGLNSIVRCALRCSGSQAGFMSALASPAQPNSDSARLVNTGMRRKALKALPTLTYSTGLGWPGPAGSECTICLTEFVSGQRVKVLPKCKHGFHARCVDRWLGSHSSCPTCRHSLLDKGGGDGGLGSTCQADCGGGPRLAESGLSPLAREGYVIEYMVAH